MPPRLTRTTSDSRGELRGGGAEGCSWGAAGVQLGGGDVGLLGLGLEAVFGTVLVMKCDSFGKV